MIRVRPFPLLHFLATMAALVVFAGVHDGFSDAARRSMDRGRGSATPAPSPAGDVSREQAEDILSQVDALDLWPELDPLIGPEVTPNGNVVSPGRPQFVVVYCRSTQEATVTDLSPEPDAPLTDELITSIGTRCNASVASNRRRRMKKTDDCMAFLCYDNDELYRRLNPPSD